MFAVAHNLTRRPVGAMSALSPTPDIVEGPRRVGFAPKAAIIQATSTSSTWRRHARSGETRRGFN
jgi:hypothetical protein